MKNNSRKVRFKIAEIYHFSRCLGIDKVPERGNNPLGMECFHFYCESIDITSNRYWSKTKSKKKRKKSVTRFFSNDRHSDLTEEMIDRDGRERGVRGLCASTPKPVTKSAVGRRCSRERDRTAILYEKDETTDEAVEAGETEGEEDNESQQSVMSIDYTSSSLQPLNPIQRKRCLEGAGVDTEKGMGEMAPTPGHLSKLREDRKQVGCKCATGGRCDAGRCSCSSEGIPCQSDGNRFPCKCGDKCTNKFGKRNYSYGKIKFHYQHTLNRGDSSEIDLAILSTVNGDCGICEKLSDDIWKNNSETQQHQTRSRKRAGEDNLENIKIFKPTPNEEIMTNGINNKNKDMNVLTELPSVLGVQEKANGKEELKMSTDVTLINPPIVTKKTSKLTAKNNLNKENIDINAVKFDVSDTSEFIPKTILLTNCSFSTPLQIQIASGSFDSPGSPLTTYHDISYNNSNSPSSFSSDIKFLSPIFSDYRQSFLNHEFFENRLLTPSQITCTPVKFNPISLATNVTDASFETRVIVSDIFSNTTQTSQNIFTPNPAEMSINNSREAKFDFSEFSRRNSNENVFKNHQIPPPESPSYSCENMESITVTSKLNQLHLRKSKSDSSLINVDSKSKPNVKCQYTFRPVKNVPNYSESPIINYCKRKSQRPKSGKVINFPNNNSTIDSVPIDLSNQIIRPCESVNMNLFLENDEISFFDIPLRNSESCNFNEKL